MEDRSRGIHGTLYLAALEAGCTLKEAETIGRYVLNDSIDAVAERMQIAPTTVAGHLGRVRRRVHAAHTSAAVVALLTGTYSRVERSNTH